MTKRRKSCGHQGPNPGGRSCNAGFVGFMQICNFGSRERLTQIVGHSEF